MSRPLGSPEELERRRRRAVELVEGGEPAGLVAHMLSVHRSSIYRWRRAAEAGSLAAKPHPHRPAALSDEQLRRLDQMLRQGAPAHGWTNDLWTTNRVAELISKHFRRCYHPDHVGRFLRERLGWSSQKPRRQARERNEEAILDWQSRVFPKIARQAQARGAHLVFLDESGFQLTPTVRKTWAPRGQTPLLKAWDRRDRISAISSLSVSPVARRINLHFDLLDDNRNVRSEDIVEYLRQLKSTLNGPLTVLWDGGRVHRSKVVQQFLAENPGIHTERLPAYAPELNPDELVWAWTKYSRLPNLAADNAGWLRDYLITEFHYLKRHPVLLRSFIDKTHIPLRL